MRDHSRSETPLSNRLRRVLSSTYGARANAAQGLDEMTESSGVVLHGPDLALFSGHPVGLSQRRAVGRMGTALWEVFPGHVALLDRDGVVISVNQAWRSYGLDNDGSPTAGLGCNYLDVCASAAAVGEPEAAAASEVIRTALSGAESDRRVRYLSADRWFSLQAFPIPGLHAGALVVHTDVTAEANDLHRWQHQALHDPLTGLPNRALIEDRLAHAIAGAAREPGSIAVLFIDLDGFKRVNDVYGHVAGDRVLQEAASRMGASLRSGDTLGRWGGDEFLVIAERLDHAGMAAELAARVSASLEQPIDIGHETVPVKLTVGVAHLDPGQPADELVDAADQALQDIRRQRGPTQPRAAR